VHVSEDRRARSATRHRRVTSVYEVASHPRGCTPSTVSADHLSMARQSWVYMLPLPADVNVQADLDI
jgi:hypothetical protein